MAPTFDQRALFGSVYSPCNAFARAGRTGLPPPSGAPAGNCGAYVAGLETVSCRESLEIPLNFSPCRLIARQLGNVQNLHPVLALRRRRVFLGRRVVLFDHEVDRHVEQYAPLLEHQRAIDHGILGQGLGDLAELELIRGRGQFDAAMRLNEQPMFDDLRTELAVFFDNLVKDAGTGSVHGRTEESLRFVAVVFDLDDAGIGAESARCRLANPGMPDL